MGGAWRNWGNWGQIPIDFFIKSHAFAARHGDAFFWSFAQKMVPRPCGFEEKQLESDPLVSGDFCWIRCNPLIPNMFFDFLAKSI